MTNNQSRKTYGSYKRNRVFENYGSYNKASQPVEYAALPTTADLKAAEIASLREKAAATKSDYNRRLYTNAADELEAK